jgi:hypothetical protein
MRTIIRSLIPALALAALPALPVATANAGIEFGLSVNFAPPALPVYEQPPVPGPGYLWIPGYWGWDGGDYYWVPGTWSFAPVTGYLWTPGYWGWGNGAYLWHAGYWGPHVGFYGGINYGFGYGGVGYQGGFWRGNEFCYNRAVNNVRNINVTNVYNRTVINNVTINRTSFSGGMGGVMARPSRAELAAAHERHVGPSSLQREQESVARSDNALRASVNGGRPPIAATPRPAAFNAHGVVAARDVGPTRTTQGPQQYRNDRPAQASQVTAPQYHTSRPAPVNQVSAQQYHTDHPLQASQVNAAQYRNDRPAQASQVSAPQSHTSRPAPVNQVSAQQYHTERAPQPTQSRPVNTPRPAAPAQAHQQMQVGQPGGQPGNTHQNHGR